MIGADTAPADVASFGRFLEEKGVRVITANSGGDLEDRSVVGSIHRCLAIAKQLGATQMVIACPKKSSAVLDHLQELADAALALGIRLALEMHPPLVTNAEVGLKTLRELNHRNIGINYDVANVYYYNEQIDTLVESKSCSSTSPTSTSRIVARGILTGTFPPSAKEASSSTK